MQVNVHTAKTNLSNLMLRAEAGEKVVIARRGKPAVRLVPVQEERKCRFGMFSNLKLTGDILAPLDEETLRDWEGS